MWNGEEILKWKMTLLFLFHHVKWSEREREKKTNILMTFSCVNYGRDFIRRLLVIFRTEMIRNGDCHSISFESP